MESLPQSGGGITAEAINMAFRTILDRFGDIDSIDADESTTSLWSSAFVDLATRGPEVSVSSRGLRALVFLSCRAWNTSAAANINAMGVQVTNVEGVVTHSPGISGALLQQGITVRIGAKRTWIMIPINLAEDGPHTFTAKYAVGAGTGFFGNRTMAVFAP